MNSIPPAGVVDANAVTWAYPSITAQNVSKHFAMPERG